MAQGPLNADLPEAVALAAREGEVDAVRDWLANGGASDAKIDGSTLLEIASSSSRPSCASVVALLCAAGARDEGSNGSCLKYAALHGAVDSVRVLLRYGANPNQVSLPAVAAAAGLIVLEFFGHLGLWPQLRRVSRVTDSTLSR